MCNAEYLDLCEACDCPDCALSGCPRLDAIADEIIGAEADA